MSDDAEFGLVMPFVVVTSKGGPYDDKPFVAGYEMGLIDAQLAAAGPWVRECEFIIHSDNAPQADLIAMRHGFQLQATAATADGEEVPEWTSARFLRDGEQ